jgi:anti-anti-sigma regulatory factor/putative methionine-R-sulfoxide reductase with GAF domain
VDARIVTPPLTTVRQPLYGQGRRAAEMLLAQLRGEDCPLQESLRMELVTRQSCACFPEEMAGVVVGKVGKTGQELQEILDGNREKGLAEMGRAAALSLEGRKEEPDPTWAECLLNAFAADLGGKVSGTFLPTLDDILRMVVAVGGDLGAWQGVLSALRRMFGAHVTGQSLVKAEDLVQQGRVLIGEMAQRVEAQRRLSGELLAATLRNVGLAMSTTISPVELTDVLVQQLPQLGIERFYLSLYEGDDRATARLILACQGTERVELGPGDRLFPTRQLIPPELWPQERRYTMALTPLFLRDRSIGLAVFEMGPRQGIIYGALQGQLSTALQGALLFRERESLLVHLESRALQLQTAAEVAQAASSILDLPVLLQRVVDLVVERFGLYYAGLMLVDADGRFATLRAGTGEAGRQMVAQGLRLEAGSHSMVGWCLTNKQPRIAADVTADPSYLKVPLLPETRSEMVVPLLIGDRVIGVLDIQSRRIGAFAEDEVLVFQTMADQLAVAIENARVVAEMRGLNEDLQRTLAMQARLVETIEALSTPVVPLINGIILLPLVGNIDSGRSQQIIDHLLAGVQAHRAKVAIVDITGVPVVDTSVANSLIRAARAVGLLGANVVLVGIRPEVAQTMVTLGVDLASMVTHSNLQNGIAYALWQLGFRIAPR